MPNIDGPSLVGTRTQLNWLIFGLDFLNSDIYVGLLCRKKKGGHNPLSYKPGQPGLPEP